MPVLKRILFAMVLITGLFVASVGLSATPANAQYCAPGSVNQGANTPCQVITGNGTSFPVGGIVELVGHGFLPASTANFAIEGCLTTTQLGTALVDDAYNVRFSFPIPADCCSGVHDVTITGLNAAGNPLVEVYQITVLGDLVPQPDGSGCHSTVPTVSPGSTIPGGGGTGTLPRTGSTTGVPLAVGFGLVVIGFGLVVIARRVSFQRRHRSSTSHP